MDVPDDPPAVCPVCETAYESVSEHADGLMVGLSENDRYRRVCFEPHTAAEDASDAPDDSTSEADDPTSEPRIRFYHHTHEQAAPE